MARTGRKTKYTQDTIDRLTQAIELGASRTMACQFASISFQTFSVWMNDKPEFSDAIKKAEATGALKWLARIEQAASDGSWQAAAWKLERRFPEEFGRRIEQSVTVNTREVAMQMAAQIGVEPEELLVAAEALLRESQLK